MSFLKMSDYVLIWISVKGGKENQRVVWLLPVLFYLSGALALFIPIRFLPWSLGDLLRPPTYPTCWWTEECSGLALGSCSHFSPWIACAPPQFRADMCSPAVLHYHSLPPSSLGEMVCAPGSWRRGHFSEWPSSWCGNPRSNHGTDSSAVHEAASDLSLFSHRCQWCSAKTCTLPVPEVSRPTLTNVLPYRSLRSPQHCG